MERKVSYTYFTEVPWLGSPLSFKSDRALPPLYRSLKWMEPSLDECTPLVIFGKLGKPMVGVFWNEWLKDADPNKINVNVRFDFQTVERAESFFKQLYYRVLEDKGNRKILSSFRYLPTVVWMDVSENVVSAIYHNPELFDRVKFCLIDGHEFGLRFIINCEPTPTALATFGRLGVTMLFLGKNTKPFFDFIDVPVEGELNGKTAYLVYKPVEDEASYGTETRIPTTGYVTSFTPSPRTPRPEEVRERRREKDRERKSESWKPRAPRLTSSVERAVYGLFLRELRKGDGRDHD